MNAISIRKDRRTISRVKPIARSAPICCRRSTTARVVTTPSPAIPTISPIPRYACIRVRTCWEASNARPISSRMSIVRSPYRKKIRSSSPRMTWVFTPGASWKKYAVYVRPGDEVDTGPVRIPDVREVLVEPVLVRVHEEVVDPPQGVVEGIGGVLPAHLRGEDRRGRDPQFPVEEA